MLLRAYRVTDRLGMVILKTCTWFAVTLLENTHTITASIRDSLRQLLKAAVMLLSVLFRGIQWLVQIFLHFLNVSIFHLIQLRGRTAITARASVVGAASNAMARRSARAELDVVITEDPLRVQNRVLSFLVVVALFALIAVVLWATNTRNNQTTSVVPGEISLNMDDTQPTTQSDQGIASLNLATPVPTATDPPEVLQVGGILAFVVREMGQTDLWVAPVDRRVQLRITNDSGDERDPAWSPDGQRIAYASNKDGNWELYIYAMDSNATDRSTRMTYNLGFEGGPDWSPDGAFLVYESYQSTTHLDIFVMQSDGREVPTPLVQSPAPDYSPAWAPGDGRRIAFTSWQEGNQDIYVLDLNTTEAINLTNTPNQHEDSAAWSPDGELIAYSAVEAGIETIFVKPANNPNAPAQAVGRGRTPAWSPDGNSIVAAVDTGDDVRIVVLPYTDTGIATQVIQVPKGSSSPDWVSAPLPTSLINSGGVELGVLAPLYNEQAEQDEGDPPYGLGPIVNITSIEQAVLSERVNDSFNALREKANAVIGWDFLGQLSDAFWRLDHRPQPGEPRQNWHMTGRAFSFNRNQIIGGFPPPVEVVREDDELTTAWRVYVRVAEDAQDGQLGEPLRHMPWAFVGPESGDVEAYNQGGRLRPEMPKGYYVDFTQLAADYGWERVPAGTDWRANANARNFWMFRKTDGLTWYDAMRELYTESQLGGWVPTPTPAPVPTTEGEQG